MNWKRWLVCSWRHCEPAGQAAPFMPLVEPRDYWACKRCTTLRPWLHRCIRCRTWGKVPEMHKTPWSITTYWCDECFAEVQREGEYAV